MFEIINEHIEKFQKEIYDAKFNQAGETLVGLTEDIASVIACIPEKKVSEFNMIITNIFDAQQKQDFLLVSDLLEYRLQPFLDYIEKKNAKEKDK